MSRHSMEPSIRVFLGIDPSQRVSSRARVISALYLVAVAACVALAFDFKGQIDEAWLLLLVVVTLPLSAMSIFFVWAMAHGAGLGFFAVIYMVWAVANVLVANWIVLVRKSSKARDGSERLERGGNVDSTP